MEASSSVKIKSKIDGRNMKYTLEVKVVSSSSMCVTHLANLVHKGLVDIQGTDFNIQAISEEMQQKGG